MTISKGTTHSYLDQPCDRCGSGRRVAKTWNETLKTFSGTSSFLQMTQVVCTNDECQRLFDKNRAEEVKKKNEIRLKKEEQDKIRKENMLKNMAEKKKTKLDQKSKRK